MRTLERRTLQVVAFKRPTDWGEHFARYYGPTLATIANAQRQGKEQEFSAALDAFCREWNLGSEDDARFEQEYLLVVATRN